MPQLTYRIENAPGKIYGKNSNELVFKEPFSGAVVYATATASGMLKSTKKQLFRGPASEKDGGVCVATIGEPGSGTLEMHHHHIQPAPSTTTAAAVAEDREDLNSKMTTTTTTTAITSSTLKMKKTSSWVPFSGKNNHAVTFRDAKYTWSGTTQLKRDSDNHVVAKVAGPWLWQGKLGDMEVDIPSSSSSSSGKAENVVAAHGGADKDREILEMCLATFVLRWWGEKVKAEEEARQKKKQLDEQKREKELEKQALASQKKEALAKEKMDEEAKNSKQDGDEQTGKL